MRPMFTTVRSRICLFQNLWRSVLLITIFLDQAAADAVDAENNGNCPPSSCGEIHGITYPFRLDTDPPNCGFSSFGGDKSFTLYCHNNSSLFLYPNNSSGRFLVEGINYDNYTIHLVDPGVQQRNCSSLPISPIFMDRSSTPYYTTGIWWRAAVFISCDRRMGYGYDYDSVEITAPCKSKIKKYSYVIVGGRVSLGRVMESCSIDMITLVPFPKDTEKNVTSYQEIHRQFSDGFHLSWSSVSCQPTCKGDCFLDEANRPTCYPRGKPRVCFYDYYNFVEITAPCKSKSKKYSYVIVGDSVYLERVMESCSIDMITLVPLTNDTMKNVTPYQEIHRQFSDGFHLSWFRVYCQRNCKVYDSCYLNEANRPTCRAIDYGIDYRIRAWFLNLSNGNRARRWYWDSIFKTIGWLLKILILLASCHKNTDPPNYCPPSSCGNILNISYPFRLDTDPPNCGFSSFGGDKNFTLYCHNNSSLFLYLNNNSGRLLVKGINYDNFTIHLVDPGVQQRNCSSLPISPLSLNYDSYYTTNVQKRGRDGSYERLPSLSLAVVFISCDRRMGYDYFYDYYYDFVEITAPCKSKSKKYSYVFVGWRRALERVMESCSIDMITLVPFPNDTEKNVPSYQEIHRQFSDGFHLSWLSVSCGQNCLRDGICLLDEANRPTCYNERNYISYNIRAWFLSIYAGYRAKKWYWDPIFKITGWLIIIFTPLGALRAAIFLLGSPCIFVFLIYQWRRRHLSLYDTIEEFLQNHNDLMPIRYSFKDIKKITSYFKDKLGEGGFGCVYKGKLRSGRLAAIKILGKSSKVTNGQDFMNEVATIGRIHHVNVVQLVGYCAEQSNRALVYDFMPNSSLDKYIFPKEGFVSLSWEKLFEISLGVARGIEYLHRGCDMQILHFDIKPHNILLDENFIPKVSDFGLAKLYPTAKDTIASLTAARGTIGYMAPELFYKNIGRVSYKADVYSFGMLLLEIAGKRKNLNARVEKSSQIYFPSWVYDQISNGDDIEIGDNATERETKIVKKMIIVGLWCIQMKPSNRPSMNKVVEMLEGDVESLEMPPKPALCLEEMPNVAETDESSDMLDNSSESISLIESAG